MVNIKVAVRIRPLSERELLRGEEIIVRKENNAVLVTNPKIPERHDGDSRQRTRRFAVDFCYDSKDPRCCSQEVVYREIGTEILQSMYEGYNACVLAYGHSASGKTYTIMGLQDDPGLTPRLCEGLFEKLPEKCHGAGIRVQVIIRHGEEVCLWGEEPSAFITFFLEIYNEKVRDLLGSEEAGGTCGSFSLRVREHPKLGPYVQGLSEHLVSDKIKLLELLAAGNKRRSTAATENNVHSSRSHAVFLIQFKQSDGANYETDKSSKVHLVDLAGSERASSSQSKARLQEGANINKSLVTLGNVISALAESCDSAGGSGEVGVSKSWQPFVPYRDSVLTWLLKDTLGGNSNTIMIATISPARSCLSETVNTLRYAKRTKKIVNQPVVNEDPKIRTIRELRKEIARLKGLLVFFQSSEKEAVSGESDSEEEPWFSNPESKWPEPEGTHFTSKRCARSEEETWGEKEFVGGEEEEEKEKEEEEGGGEGGGRKWGFEGRAAPPGAPQGRDACEMGDEKESDVNGSTNDSFSHETQIFSDSLESFSCVFAKGGNWCDTGDDAPEKPDADHDERDMRGKSAGSLDLRLSKGSPSRKGFPGMLHRSRPDLIKGIATRAKESSPLGSSQSCTDVSNLSHSTSENSLNSSGSADVQSPDSRLLHNPGANKHESAQRESSGANFKKKDNRLEIVKAVTSRLYETKKKQKSNAELPKKEVEDDDDDGELEELKLCKRARMKLFDLSRKLALTRKLKKTVDCDTQTDATSSTLRVKEKGVTTDPSEVPGEGWVESRKPHLIMNQVFIPRASGYVVACGEVVRIQVPGFHKPPSTPPVKLSPREEDSFSEDSLDMEVKGKGRGRGGSQEVSREDLELVGALERRRGEEEREGSGRTSLTVFPRGEVGRGFFITETSDGGSRKKEGNASSENSFTSTEGTEPNSLSETSSEDFVFYENLKDKDLVTGAKRESDRELYTITENSEQSDPSEGFSPVQNQESPFKAAEEGGKALKWSASWRGRKPDDDESKEQVREFEEPKRAKAAGHSHRGPDSSARGLESLGNAPKAAPSAAKRASRSSGGLEPSEREANRFMEDLPERKEAPNNRTGFDQSNSQRQYLNLNISSSNGTGRTAPFSVDTHLFGRDLKKDRSADAMSTSADSITFVFMGPAKPRTSVLMEIIRRSLGRGSLTGDGPFAQRRSRSRGVQCDGRPMRSVSVDTAMIALSRIARNQEPSSEMQRTASLGALGMDEALPDLEEGNLRSQGERGWCGEGKKFPRKHSVGTSTGFEERKGSWGEEAGKPKKSVSWFGEGQGEDEGESGEDGGGVGMGGPGFPERRVRFLKPSGGNGNPVEPADDLKAFLREATHLLKSINSHSSGYRLLPGESDTDLRNKDDEGRKGGVKMARKWYGAPRGRTEGCSEKDAGWRSRTGAAGTEDSRVDLTWPRRRPTTGKPPTGTKPKPLRSFLPPRLDSLHSSGASSFTSSPRAWSQSSRTESRAQSWNLSDLTVAFSNSCLGDPHGGTLGSRTCNGETKWARDSWSAPITTPRPNSPKPNFDSVSDLELELEESCRRLEMAAERDEARERHSENKKVGFEGSWKEERQGGGGGVAGTERWVESRKPREPIKRRKTEKCAGSCGCRRFGTREPCKYLWSKGCRSSFELDSFGPGSAHCHQLCMFCRKKEAETYFSALSLNSQCSPDACRLNFYGFCPCSPVKLNQVVQSPRAYMQHLLALRKRIVSETKPGEQHPPRGPSGLSDTPNFW